MKAERVPVVPPISPKKASPKTSAAAEPKRKKSYHSVAVPIRLAKTTFPIEGFWTVPGGVGAPAVVVLMCVSLVLVLVSWCVRSWWRGWSGGGPPAVHQVGGAVHRGGAGTAEESDHAG